MRLAIRDPFVHHGLASEARSTVVSPTFLCVLCAHARNASRSDAGGSFAAIPS